MNEYIAKTRRLTIKDDPMINLDSMIGILYYHDRCIEYPMNRGSPTPKSCSQ